MSPDEPPSTPAQPQPNVVYVPVPIGFERPPLQPDTKLWRYMDMPKFLSMLLTDSINFTRTDKLGDTHEGSVPVGALPNIGSLYEGHEEAREWLTRTIRSKSFVSCWFEYEHESTAMWGGYAHDGIAIQSTYGKLQSEFQSGHVQIERVKYLDYDADLEFDPRPSAWLFTKRIAFESEREVRMVLSGGFHPYVQEGLDTTGSNVAWPVFFGVSQLIEKIVISPTAPEWYETLVKQLLERLGIRRPVTRSVLKGPVHY